MLEEQARKKVMRLSCVHASTRARRSVIQLQRDEKEKIREQRREAIAAGTPEKAPPEPDASDDDEVRDRACVRVCVVSCIVYAMQDDAHARAKAASSIGGGGGGGGAVDEDETSEERAGYVCCFACARARDHHASLQTHGG
jgi:hypothetical protein